MCFWNIDTSIPKHKPFLILKLPLVPFKLVTEFMNSHEIIKLSMCSYRLESFLRISKYKLKKLTVHLSDQRLRYDLTQSNNCSSIFFRKGKSEKPLESVSKMQQFCEIYDNEDNTFLWIEYFSSKTIIGFHECISALYSCSSVSWKFYLDILSTETMMHYLNLPLAEKCTGFSFLRGSLSTPLLTELLDKIPVSKRLEIDSDIPIDFKHPNALKYYVARYHSGRWITLNDLKSIRNVGCVELKSTIFDCSDVNQFLNYWVNCEEDMIQLLDLNLQEGAIIDVDALTDQLITVHVEGARSPDFFIKAKNHKNRKFALGHLEIGNNKLIRFSSWEAIGDRHLFGILESLERKKELEKEIAMIEKRGNQSGISNFSEEMRQNNYKYEELRRLKISLNEQDHVIEILSNNKYNPLHFFRYRFRRTSKSEMSIIDGLPISFESVTVINEDLNPCTSVVIVQDKNNKFTITSRQLYFKQDTIVPLLNYILEKGHVEQFVVRSSEKDEVFSNGPNLEDSVAMKWELSRFLREMKQTLHAMEETLKPQTNWSDLPSELKMECIDYMTLMERWNLRQTAHVERDLVNSQRLFAETVIVDEKFFSFTTKSGIGNVFISYEYDPDKLRRTCPFILFVFQKLVANVLKIDDESYRMMSTLTIPQMETESLELNTIIVFHNSFIELYCWLSMLKKCVNVVIVERNEEGLDIFPDFPAVLNAETIQYIDAKNIGVLESFLNAWIEQPPKLNSNFQMRFKSFESIESLREMNSCIESRVGENEGCDVIVLATNDPKKIVIVVQETKQREVFVCLLSENQELSTEFFTWKQFVKH
ncbi:hypothetical protein CRE_01605 [Caenorhabditis remanei]|uniref:F-box domain-containing protein n=1 Tax=Caenorhabditis remanei TaxID=31234 RepID=E3LGR1_CAERE|nr:hypothetical protein CRE_01605 [Caenorhabditis remanei]